MRTDKLQQARDAVKADNDVVSRATASPIEVPKIDIPQEAYKSAKEVAQAVGTDKVFKVPIKHDVQWCGSDYSDGYSLIGNMFFYAKDLDGAKDKLKLFEKINNKPVVKYAMSLVDTGHDMYEFGTPVEVTPEQASAEIEHYLLTISDWEKKKTYFVSLCDHILCLPTVQMYEDMEKSIQWAVNVLKKMKDQDEADKRIKWLLQTPDGKAWLAKYDADKKVLDALEEKAKEAAQKKQAKDEQQKQNEEALYDILTSTSDKYPQYKDHIAPVIVEGGRKFKGKGIAISIQEHFANDYYYTTDTDASWFNAVIYDYVNDKIGYAQIKFCKIDTSVSNEECLKIFEQYCKDKVKKTLEWCKSKDPSKSEFELKRWATNIIKKYHPYIDVSKFIAFDQKELDDADTKKVASTVDWAIGLGEGQAKTERIIMKALAKKGIDYKKYQALISIKLVLRFGHDPKVMEF